MPENRQTIAVEAAFWRAVAEAAMFGRDMGLLRGVAEALGRGDEMADDIAGAMMARGARWTGTWAILVRAISEAIDKFGELKALHGPTEFRAILAELARVECLQPILDDEEREALGLAVAPKGGNQHAT